MLCARDCALGMCREEGQPLPTRPAPLPAAGHHFCLWRFLLLCVLGSRQPGAPLLPGLDLISWHKLPALPPHSRPGLPPSGRPGAGAQGPAGRLPSSAASRPRPPVSPEAEPGSPAGRAGQGLPEFSRGLRSPRNRVRPRRRESRRKDIVSVEAGTGWALLRPWRRRPSLPGQGGPLASALRPLLVCAPGRQAGGRWGTACGWPAPVRTGQCSSGRKGHVALGSCGLLKPSQRTPQASCTPLSP